MKERFTSCTCAKRKIQTFEPASDVEINEAMTYMNNLFPFFPKDLVNCTVDIFRKSKEGREFANAHFRSNSCSFQLSKVPGCNCAYCIVEPKKKTLPARMAGFIPPPAHDEQLNKFITTSKFCEVIDMEEKLAPSKVIKAKENSNAPNIKRKSNVRGR